MGRSGWAVVNSFHASIIETDFRPNEIIVIFEEAYGDAVKPVIQGLEIIQETYGEKNVQGIEVPNWDTIAAGNVVRTTVDKAKEAGARIALDITGGRKALVTGALLALKSSKPEHVFYLAIERLDGVAKPYPLIPKRIQQLFDFITNEEQVGECTFGPSTAETDILLSRDCMMAVLNLAYSRGEKISVKAPLIDLELLEIDMQKGKITTKIDREKYQERLDANRNANLDHPSYGDFKRCLCYSGALEFENASELDTLFEEFSKTYDSQTGVRRNFLALDANMFYNGFPSTLMRLERKLGIDSKDVLCVTPYPAFKEVRKQIRHKYNKNTLADARKFYRSNRQLTLIDELQGQNTLRTRSAKMAKAQLANFMERPVHLKTDAVNLPNDKEEVDHLIVDSLEAFAKKNGVRVTLLSSDKNMLDICDLADDVGVKILRFPTSIPESFRLTDEVIVDMLIALSLLFGAIELGKIGFLLGEYRGKVSSKYTDEVKLRVVNKDRAKTLQERITICERLMQIGITR